MLKKDENETFEFMWQIIFITRVLPLASYIIVFGPICTTRPICTGI